MIELLQFLPAQVGVAIAIMIFFFWAVRAIRNIAGSDSTYRELVDTMREEIKTLRSREKESNDRVDRFAHERNEVIHRMGAMESTIKSQEEKNSTLEGYIKELEESKVRLEDVVESQSVHIVK